MVASLMRPLRHILLVDDNEADNEYHEIVIKESKLANTVKSVSNTKEAMQHLKRCLQPGTKTPLPDLIFLDIHMPRKDGFQFTKELKDFFSDKQELKSKIRIFMLSGNYDPVMEMYLNTPNYDDLITGYRLKPLSHEMLSEIIKRYF